LGETSEAPALGLMPKGASRYALIHDEITITLWKFSKIAVTKCHIVRIKCIQFDFRWGSVPDPPRWGSLQRSPNSLAVFKGPTSNWRGGEREEQERDRRKGETE